jgi:choline dehydrogenase
MPSSPEFDFIVVGAGTTGCVVAARLSARGHSVLLLEAGVSDTGPPDVTTAIAQPDKFLESLAAKRATKRYETTPQVGLGAQPRFVCQGSVRGVGSAVNGMVYVRGNRRDYDMWAQLGNQGWSYDDVLPYFIRAERFAHGGSEYHGNDGPVDVRWPDRSSLAATAFIDAARQVFTRSDLQWDFNGPQQENAAGLYQVTVTPNGRRASAAFAYLDSVASPATLSVQTGAVVTRIIVERDRAVGVTCTVDGAALSYRAHREVIVSAGAFESPKLLMLSGIGPADHLNERAIAPVIDLPGVGQNLQDHLQLLIFHPTTYEPGQAAFTAEAGLFMNSRDTSSGVSPDLQFHVLGDFPGSIRSPRRSDALGQSSPFLICPVLCKPQSRGVLRLREDPHQPPVIDPNYLECDADTDVLLRGIGWAEHFARLGALGKMLDREVRPYVVKNPFTDPQFSDLPDGRRERQAIIRDHVVTAWQPTGTCKMGLDKLAVVNPRLEVHGIEGLRVADASIMPVIPSGNTNAACYMIGEKCADLVP